MTTNIVATGTASSATAAAIKAKTDGIGSNADAATDPGLATGTLFSKLRGTVAALVAALVANATFLSLWRRRATTTFHAANVGSGAVQTVLDVGNVAGTTTYRLDDFGFTRTLGTNTQILLELFAEVNGALVSVYGPLPLTAAGRAWDVLGPMITSRRIKLTVTGDNAANDGDFAASIETSQAGA